MGIFSPLSKNDEETALKMLSQWFCQAGKPINTGLIPAWQGTSTFSEEII